MFFVRITQLGIPAAAIALAFCSKIRGGQAQERMVARPFGYAVRQAGPSAPYILMDPGQAAGPMYVVLGDALNIAPAFPEMAEGSALVREGSALIWDSPREGPQADSVQAPSQHSGEQQAQPELNAVPVQMAQTPADMHVQPVEAYLAPVPEVAPARQYVAPAGPAPISPAQTNQSPVQQSAQFISSQVVTAPPAEIVPARPAPIGVYQATVQRASQNVPAAAPATGIQQPARAPVAFRPQAPVQQHAQYVPPPVAPAVNPAPAPAAANQQPRRAPTSFSPVQHQAPVQQPAQYVPPPVAHAVNPARAAAVAYPARAPTAFSPVQHQAPVQQPAQYVPPPVAPAVNPAPAPAVANQQRARAPTAFSPVQPHTPVQQPAEYSAVNPAPAITNQEPARPPTAFSPVQPQPPIRQPAQYVPSPDAFTLNPTPAASANQAEEPERAPTELSPDQPQASVVQSAQPASTPASVQPAEMEPAREPTAVSEVLASLTPVQEAPTFASDLIESDAMFTIAQATPTDQAQIPTGFLTSLVTDPTQTDTTAITGTPSPTDTTTKTNGLNTTATRNPRNTTTNGRPTATPKPIEGSAVSSVGSPNQLLNMVILGFIGVTSFLH